MQEILKKLQTILDGADQTYDAEQIADALWLSQYLDKKEVFIEEKKEPTQKIKTEIKPAKKPEVEKSKLPQSETQQKVKKVIIETDIVDEVSVHVSTKSTKNSGIPIHIKQISATLNQSKLYNALKYFRKKRVSNRKTTLDIDKTVDIKADTKLFIPTYKSEYENAYSLLLLIDNSDVMELWSEEVEYFVKSIKSFNLFKNVEEIYIDSSKKEPEFFKSKKLKSQKTTLLRHLSQDTIVMIISDMSNHSWQSLQLIKMLYKLQNRAKFCAIEMFPTHLWNKSILKDADIVRFRSNRNRRFNKTLKSDSDDILEFMDSDFKNKKLLKLPIATLELNSLEALSKVIVGRDDSFISGAIFYADKDEKERVLESISDSKRVSMFYENSSKTAHNLAHYLSVVPLDMHVMKVVQKLMIEDSTKTHLSEILTSGLLKKEDELYQFYHDKTSKDGVREILQNQLGTLEYTKTIDELSKYVQNNLDLGFSSLFKAILQDSDTKEVGKLNRLDTEFAKINIKRLKRLGGKYEKIAKRLTIEIEAIIPHSKRFQMGSEEYDDEKPIHEVVFNYDFEIAQYLVTFEEYDLFCEDTGKDKPDDRGWGRGNRPVINVSWYDAKEYCKWLSEKTGEEYRLPTEAEWEYACRAGTTTKWSFGDDENKLKDYAWYEKNSGGKTHPVGEKKPNPWGLYDMHGNVWEWCEDDYIDNYKETPRDGSANTKGKQEYKVLRGGSWINYASKSRSANRYGYTPSFRFNFVGFRLLRTLSNSLSGLNIIESKRDISINNIPSSSIDVQKINFNNFARYIGLKGNQNWYDWVVYVDEPIEILNEIESVEYTLHSTFKKPNRRTGDKKNNFSIESSGWGEFEIKTKVYLKHGSQINGSYRLDFSKKWDSKLFNIEKLMADITFKCQECHTRYAIDCDDLKWEAVESHERGMGAEINYEAYYEIDCDNCDNIMSLTFNCWEYPVGAENLRDVQGEGVEDIKGDCCLDFHESDNMEYIQEAIGEIKEWFFKHYEDPANSLPYESKEGGYQWIHGEPVDTSEAIYENFEEKYSEDILKKVIDEIGRHELWSPIPQSEEEFQDTLEKRVNNKISADSNSRLKKIDMQKLKESILKTWGKGEIEEDNIEKNIKRYNKTKQEIRKINKKSKKDG